MKTKKPSPGYTKVGYCYLVIKSLYYIETDEIVPRIFPFTKTSLISSSHTAKILFLSFTCEDIGVVLVIIKMMSQ